MTPLALALVACAWDPPSNEESPEVCGVAEDPLRCAACGIDVADRDAIVSIGGRPTMGTFANPVGVLFEVLTVAVARHLVVHRPPSTAFSWFPGCAWSIATCARCGIHLGWTFEGATAGFVGLIRPRVR